METRITNITCLYDDVVKDNVSQFVSELRGYFIDVFESPPILTELPDVIFLIDPKSNASIQSTRNRLIVSDQNVGPLGERRDVVEKLIRLLLRPTSELTIGKMGAYGLNFQFSFEHLNSNHRKNLENLSKPNVLKKGEELLFAGLNTVYRRDDGSRIQISSTPYFSLKKGHEDEVTKVVFDCNCHYKASELPEFSVLNKAMFDTYEYFDEKLNSWLGLS